MHSETCFMKNSKSTTDLLLTNKALNIKETLSVEKGVSDYSKMITTFFKAHSSRLRPKVILYINRKEFSESSLLSELHEANIQTAPSYAKQNYVYS